MQLVMHLAPKRRRQPRVRLVRESAAAGQSLLYGYQVPRGLLGPLGWSQEWWGTELTPVGGWSPVVW